MMIGHVDLLSKKPVKQDYGPETGFKEVTVQSNVHAWNSPVRDRFRNA